MTRFSRRQIFGAGVLAAIVATPGGDQDTMLDQVLRTYRSPHVANYHVDPDGRMLRDRLAASHEAEFSDPQYWREQKDWFLPQLLLQGVSEEMYDRLFDNPSLKQKLEAALTEYEWGQVVGEAHTFEEPLLFGKGRQSDVYLFDGSFARSEMLTTRGREITVQGADRLIVNLLHENRHAEQSANGFALIDGTVIDGTTFSQISGQILGLAREADAYTSAAEQSMRKGLDGVALLAVLDLQKYQNSFFRAMTQAQTRELVPFEEHVLEQAELTIRSSQSLQDRILYK